MKPVVIDNFLDEQSFQNLQNIMFGENFCWVYNGAIDYEDDEDKFQFTHSFYKNNIGPSSQQYGKLSHILNKIRPKEIFRIKANLLSRTSEIVENSFHVDIVDLGILPWTTAVFYMNTNNGYTEFETGAKVESVENRMLVFPAEMKHRGTSCTDKKIRVVVNFNYLT
tara:strand:- start:82 stop:582 length:501 start_codon:yes stop_codon:yes gene_type:complete